MPKTIDLTGQKFGRLTAIRVTGERTADGRIIWLCLCGCGNEARVARDSLRSGKTKSCGCLHKEHIVALGKFYGAENGKRAWKKNKEEGLRKREEYKAKFDPEYGEW